ncbi:zinc ABC transporter substrate-binding protein [Thiomicrorhabdus chilensis]|uniref:zinc ABC transporter substrate-binding protein n=1 Tax=Thiomicrorhabdus chilensis TaxID=63656 RepID=UPI0004217F7D|nr:zinc ABC transporter substrate-binding protein [Thiomicrorhabdus chilensis]
MTRKMQKIVGLLSILWVWPLYAVEVTVSIPPLAGIVAPLLEDDDRLNVLLDPGVSPHGFQLKPSHLWALQKSDLVLTVGTPVDAWLDKSLAHDSMPVLKMRDLNGVELLPIRRGGVWEKADQASHDHDHERERDHDEDKVSDALKNYDGHLWLSLHNAKLLIQAVSLHLQSLKPERKHAIERKTEIWLAELERVDQALRQQMALLKDKPFIVLHDAYQYFERYYGLNGVGSIRLNPALSPSLKRIQSLRKKISQHNVHCVFKEPQFPEKRVLAVISGLQVKVGSLDPMGVYQPGTQTIEVRYRPYDELLINMAQAFDACLAGSMEKP